MLNTEIVERLVQVEDLAEKKCKIYSRLLTEPTLAKQMEELASHHETRKKTLLKKVFKGDENED